MIAMRDIARVALAVSLAVALSGALGPARAEDPEGDAPPEATQSPSVGEATEVPNVTPWHAAAAKAAAALSDKAAKDAAPAPAPAPAEQPKPAAPEVAKPGEPAAPEPAAAAKPEPDPPASTQSLTKTPAKKLFGAVKVAAPLAARSIGSYARGCLAGAVALPTDGPAWQAMRLSRNRNWGHPKLIALVEKLASDVKAKDGWPGLLVGDISQPRGGPMLTGHASHQVGLDADLWFTPMPSRRLSKSEREKLAATSMLASDNLTVNPKVWGDGQYKIVKRAASYPEVERILVHPAIKKALCEKAGGEGAWLAKVRPYWGHFYHFHVRIGCPAGSSACKPQGSVPGDSGCTKELDDWFKRLTAPPPKPAVPAKPVKPKPPLMLADLPAACRTVLAAGADPATKTADAKSDVPSESARTESEKPASVASTAAGEVVPEPVRKPSAPVKSARKTKAKKTPEDPDYEGPRP